VGVWLAGCQRRCPGCLSPDFFEPTAEQKMSPLKAARLILAKAKELDLTAVTVSGGEPFERPRGLKKLLSLLKRGGLKDALVYSGYPTKELLAQYPWVPMLVAALVDGHYRENEPSLEIFRGSRNQRLTVFRQDLAPTYAAWSERKKRQAQFIVANGQIRALGIPARGDYERAFAVAEARLAPKVS
jgi:anaerobic ribonucleoside-triphosphate reductase activating protein